MFLLTSLRSSDDKECASVVYNFFCMGNSIVCQNTKLYCSILVHQTAQLY